MIFKNESFYGVKNSYETRRNCCIVPATDLERYDLIMFKFNIMITGEKAQFTSDPKVVIYSRGRMLAECNMSSKFDIESIAMSPQQIFDYYDDEKCDSLLSYE